MAGLMKREKRAGACAPVKRSIVLGALTATALLAAAVCFLHGANAVGLRGAIRVSDCAAMESNVGRLAKWQGETVELSQADDERFITYVWDIHAEHGVLYISGALMRLHQDVGEVRVRVGLIAEELSGEDGPVASENVLLLNTQLVREWDLRELAEEYSCDDHCGFAAAVRESALRTAPEGWQYRIVLIDETDGAPRLFETGCWVALDKDGLERTIVLAPGGEARRDE